MYYLGNRSTWLRMKRLLTVTYVASIIKLLIMSFIWIRGFFSLVRLNLLCVLFCHTETKLFLYARKRPFSLIINGNQQTWKLLFNLKIYLLRNCFDLSLLLLLLYYYYCYYYYYYYYYYYLLFFWKGEGVVINFCFNFKISFEIS